MRVTCILLLWLIGSRAIIAEEADNYPYTAQIVRDNTPVRSGPAQDYYPTEMLNRGDQVEIYRHVSGDWYAIRPPQKSFSWVPAHHLRLQENNLAEVINDGAVAYVGSRLSDSRSVNQVHLKAGEILEIVGEKEIDVPENDIAETWYKIAPPSGEFRWVYGPDVGDRGAPLLAEFPAAVEENSESIVQLEYQAGVVSGAPSNQKLADDTERIDLQLSLIVSRPVPTWNFTELKKRADADLEGAQTALDRGRARLVLGEISRFEKLKKEYLAITATTINPVRSSVAVTVPSSNPLEKIPNFDAVGRLTPVVSRKPGAPKFALTGVDGKVVMFITSSLGVDLQPYLGKVVGVSGTRGYMPRLKKAHLSVSQVEQLEPTALLAVRPQR